MIKVQICQCHKKVFMCLIESRCISMTLSVVVLSLKVCFCPRVPLKQTSLGSRRSSILSEVKGRGCHFDDTPFLTSSLSSLTCTKLTVFAKTLLKLIRAQSKQLATAPESCSFFSVAIYQLSGESPYIPQKKKTIFG